MSYWWPRRKWTQRPRILKQLIKRAFNDQALEGRNVDDPKNMPFLEQLAQVAVPKTFGSKTERQPLSTEDIANDNSGLDDDRSISRQSGVAGRTEKEALGLSANGIKSVTSDVLTKSEGLETVADRFKRGNRRAQFESTSRFTGSSNGDFTVADCTDSRYLSSKDKLADQDFSQTKLKPDLALPPIINTSQSHLSSRSVDNVDPTRAKLPDLYDLSTPSNSSDKGINLQSERPDAKSLKLSTAKMSTSTSSVNVLHSVSHSKRQSNEQISVPTAVGESQRAEMEVEWIDNELYPIGNQQTHASLNVRRVVGEPLKDKAISKSIHILGTGPVGRYIAHCLVSAAEAPPVTLLVHRPLLVQQWYDEGRTIKLIKNNRVEFSSKLNIESSSTFHTSDTGQLPKLRSRPDTVIENLIVTTDGPETVSALSAIKHRLRNYSTVCFIQDGLGIIDRVNSSVFSQPASRPSYMLGNITHDLQSTGSNFTVFERRPGTLSLTIIPPTFEITGQARKLDFGWTARSRYLIRTLCRAPELQARGLIPRDFYRMQLEKLAISSVLGSISVVYNCTNDQLLNNFQVSRTMELLLKEISLIIQQLPEVSHISDIDQYFCPKRLKLIILSVIEKTGKNRTSMLQAVMNGRRTNIDFSNGYLLDRAAELGIDCPNLDMIVAIVKGKQAMISREKNSYIPFGTS